MILAEAGISQNYPFPPPLISGLSSIASDTLCFQVLYQGRSEMKRARTSNQTSSAASSAFAGAD